MNIIGFIFSVAGAVLLLAGYRLLARKKWL